MIRSASLAALAAASMLASAGTSWAVPHSLAVSRMEIDIPPSAGQWTARTAESEFGVFDELADGKGLVLRLRLTKGFNCAGVFSMAEGSPLFRPVSTPPYLPMTDRGVHRSLTGKPGGWMFQAFEGKDASGTPSALVCGNSPSGSLEVWIHPRQLSDLKSPKVQAVLRGVLEAIETGMAALPPVETIAHPRASNIAAQAQAAGNPLPKRVLPGTGIQVDFITAKHQWNATLVMDGPMKLDLIERLGAQKYLAFRLAIVPERCADILADEAQRLAGFRRVDRPRYLTPEWLPVALEGRDTDGPIAMICADTAKGALYGLLLSDDPLSSPEVDDGKPILSALARAAGASQVAAPPPPAPAPPPAPIAPPAARRDPPPPVASRGVSLSGTGLNIVLSGAESWAAREVGSGSVRGDLLERVSPADPPLSLMIIWAQDGCVAGLSRAASQGSERKSAVPHVPPAYYGAVVLQPLGAGETLTGACGEGARGALVVSARHPATLDAATSRSLVAILEEVAQAAGIRASAPPPPPPPPPPPRKEAKAPRPPPPRVAEEPYDVEKELPEEIMPGYSRFAVRAGIGGHVGVLGVGLEYRLSPRIGIAIGSGTHALSGGLSLSLREGGGFYLDGHATWVRAGLLGRDVGEGVGFGATIGYDFRFWRVISIKAGIGAAYSTARAEDEGQKLLAFDLNGGLVF